MLNIYNIENVADQIIVDLKLNKSRKPQIKRFLETVSEYKLNKYIKFVKENSDFVNILKTKIKEEHLKKDNWDIVVFLYRYNIKLSASLYPYVYIFETTLKTKINQYMSERHGSNWISHNVGFLSTYKKTRKVIKNLENYKSDQEFIEKETTLGFWTAIIQYNPFWNNQKQGICLKDLFHVKSGDDIEQKRIFAELESIRVLRNKIAHFEDILLNLIFDRKINFKNSKTGNSKFVKAIKCTYSVEIVHKCINDLFKLLISSEIESLIKDIQPYSETFEGLYNKIQETFHEMMFERLSKE